jgi:hypothetical protein
MTQCFCGCGRKLGFRARRVAGWAKMIDDRLTELRPRVEWLEPSERETLSAFLKDGETMKAELLRFAHIKAGADTGDDPEANVCGVDVREIKRWLRKANTLLAAAHRERDANITAMGQAILDSGMTTEEYRKAVFAQGQRNVRAWAEKRGLSEQAAWEAVDKMPPAEATRIIGPPTLE